VFVRPPADEGYKETDQARRETAQLLGRVIAGGTLELPQDAFRRLLAFGEFADRDEMAATMPIAQAWRGAILRNYSVGAWRRLWSWLVDLLGEPASLTSLANQLSSSLPDMSVAEMIEALPDRLSDGVLLPAEDVLRGAHWAPDPFTELQLLTIGALRLDDLTGVAFRAFAGSEEEDDLGPRWFRTQLDARRAEDLHDFGSWLAEVMVLRAQRVALTKMDFDRRTGKFWIPSRIRERAGLISRLSTEGWFDVGLRVDTFANVLAGCGVLERTADGVWGTTEEGEAALA
jgi:hypothetical protein